MPASNAWEICFKNEQTKPQDNKGKSGTLKFCTPYSSYYIKKERGHESSIQLYKTGLQRPEVSHESIEKHSQSSGVKPETDFAVGLGREALAELCKDTYTVPATPHLALTSRVNAF